MIQKFWEALLPLFQHNNELYGQTQPQGETGFVTHRYEQDTYDIGVNYLDWLRKHGVSNPVVYFTDPKV
jgi:hypothetical protein